MSKDCDWEHWKFCSLNFSVVVAVCPVSECMGCSAEDVIVVDLVNHHPSPLLYFYKWSNLVPIHISLLSASVPQQHRGLMFHGVCFDFYCRGGCRYGGIGQCFLDSNKFSDIDPAPGHGVPALVGIFSSGGS